MSTKRMRLACTADKKPTVVTHLSGTRAKLYEKTFTRTLGYQNIAAVMMKPGKAQKAWVVMLGLAVLMYVVLVLVFAFLFTTHRMQVDHEWGVLIFFTYLAWVAYRALQKRRNAR